MGVAGLLKALGDVSSLVHISAYRGKCVGIDAYCFLHRGKLACAEALMAGRPTILFLKPMMEVVAVLRNHGVEPFAVFDGGSLPIKQDTEKSRCQARERAQWRAGALLRAGGTGTQEQATKLLGNAVEITPEMAAECTKHLQAAGVRCLVAPCEADAQLAHLATSGQIHACISEDVDLLAYGCQRVLFGIDVCGQGREIQLANISKSRSLLPYRFSPERLLDLCVLSGCDYIPGIPKVGIKTAALLLHRSGGDVSRSLQLAQREGFVVPTNHKSRLLEARLAYLHQTIFDHVTGCLRPLRPVPTGVELPPGRLGPSASEVPTEVACAVAQGHLHPVTFEPFSSLAGSAASHALVDASTCSPIIAHASSQVMQACVATLPSTETMQPSPSSSQQFRAVRPVSQQHQKQREQHTKPEHEQQQCPQSSFSLKDPKFCAESIMADKGERITQCRSPVKEATIAVVPFRTPRMLIREASPFKSESGSLSAKRRRLGCRICV
mmetsp:Transcript_124292/g.247766  ORF Transcript_124292/g.247766 Transcript_124292/m.247766 type:complete len:496 (+) Transcript_124292:117-1604(+)